MLPLQPVFVFTLHIIYDIFPILTIAREFGRMVYSICPILLIATEFGNILYFICLISLIASEFGNILYFICLILLIATEFGNILYFICLILQDAIKIGKIFSQIHIYVFISATRIDCEFSFIYKNSGRLVIHLHPSDHYHFALIMFMLYSRLSDFETIFILFF